MEISKVFVLQGHFHLERQGLETMNHDGSWHITRRTHSGRSACTHSFIPFYSRRIRSRQGGIFCLYRISQSTRSVKSVENAQFPTPCISFMSRSTQNRHFYRKYIHMNIILVSGVKPYKLEVTASILHLNRWEQTYHYQYENIKAEPISLCSPSSGRIIYTARYDLWSKPQDIS